jgi:hypothetical protein
MITSFGDRATEDLLVFQWTDGDATGVRLTDYH